jgi:hypothetical protein
MPIRHVFNLCRLAVRGPAHPLSDRGVARRGVEVDESGIVDACDLCDQQRPVRLEKQKPTWGQ